MTDLSRNLLLEVKKNLQEMSKLHEQQQSYMAARNKL